MPRQDDEHDKRQRILAAAEKLFVGRRFHEVTTDAIAKEAQVSKGTIYRFFEDKDDLLFQTVTAGFDELCEQVEALRKEQGTAPDLLLQACQAISRYFHHRRRVIHMMQAEETRAMVTQGRARQRWELRRVRLIDAMASLIEQGQDRGEVRQDYPASPLAAILLGMMRARARDQDEQGNPRLQVPQVVELFIQGIGLSK